jgi:predicted amidohydrolase
MAPDKRLRIASAQYDIGFLRDWEAYRAKIRQWVEDAAAEKAELLVFPEYFSMELASLFPEDVYRSLSLQLEAMQSLSEDFLNLFGEMARTQGLYIAAGTFPVRIADGSFRNRCFLFDPENEQWLIGPGSDIEVFDTEFGRIGIEICYDSEFPMFARRQVELGADLILVPSCTDTLAGYHRVRIGCQARALENQCFVVQSPTVGAAPWSEAVDVNRGAAAVYTPVDYGFPDDGILAIGKLDQSQWVYADLDLGSIARIRETGQVFNYRDWPLQFQRN